MNDRNPALDLVVTGPVENVRCANRGRRARRFDGGKERFVIHDAVAQQNFLDSLASEIPRGRVIESARASHAKKQRCIGSIPEAMRSSIRLLRGGGDLQLLSLWRLGTGGGVLSAQRDGS